MDDESEIPNIEDLEAKLADVTLIFEATVRWRRENGCTELQKATEHFEGCYC